MTSVDPYRRELLGRGEVQTWGSPRHRLPRGRWWAFWLALLAGSSLVPAATARAAADAGLAGADAEVLPDQARALRHKEQQIRALLAGHLAADIEPQSLFDVAISADDGELRVERRRIELLLELGRAAAGPAAPTAGALTDKGTQARPPAGAAVPASDSADAGVRPADEGPSLDSSIWSARLALDQARLAFYELSRERRVDLVRQHEKRRQQAAPVGHAQAMHQAERAAHRAEEQELEARERARQASTEAARLINEEYARLLTVTRAQAEYERSLLQRQANLAKRNEEVLAWRRRVMEITSSGPPDAASRASADSIYVELRRTLHSAREQLSTSLGAAGDVEQHVPWAGPDPLSDLPAEADRSVAVLQRNLVVAKTLALAAMETRLEATEADQLMSEIETLNRLRLELLPTLSAVKRNSVLGFTPAGWDQAMAEVRQVILTLRYHLSATYSWLVAIRDGDSRGPSAWLAFVLALKWAFPLGLFIWWRRRADGVLESLRRRQRESSRARLGSNWIESRYERALEFLQRVRGPLEWLLLIGAVTWLLPVQVQSLLEVSLTSTTLLWIFGGHFIVLSIDALAAQSVPGLSRQSVSPETAALRLRSLRLVGRAVVGFGLLLSLSDQLVGQGTVHSWVFSTCWFAALPILLLLISWWRPFIFERFARMRKLNAFESWVLSRRAPPHNVLASVLSSSAAVVGGLYVFAAGAARVVRSRVLTFQLTRRVLAYLFQRDLSKKAREAPAATHVDISNELFRALDPERPCEEPVRSVADAQVEDVIQRIRAAGGGAIAIVGERGAGKTTLVARIVKASPGVISLSCTVNGLSGLRSQLNRALGLSPDTTLEVAAQRLERADGDRGLLIDDAHFLVRPLMGGLVDFDAVLALLRAYSKHCTWILAFDEVIWHFIQRTRGTQPLFDDVIRLRSWSEDAIVRLVTQRNLSAGLRPDFSGLASDLPANADETDVLDAVRSTEANYYRLLWHYATGNPGVALHFWRRSLGIDASGKVLVRLFDAPEAGQLEQLPDSAAFVLRAIIQLGWATPEDIIRVTSLAKGQVADALRYGSQLGYFDVDGTRYRIAWDWFRAITRFLQRRHLLFTVP